MSCSSNHPTLAVLLRGPESEVVEAGESGDRSVLIIVSEVNDGGELNVVSSSIGPRVHVVWADWDVGVGLSS
jgi:hypothetical protein